MSKKNADDTNNTDDEFVNIDDVSGELVKCYQIQVDKNGLPKPIFIGSFKEIPLVSHTTILYDQAKDRLNVDEKRIEEGNGKSRDLTENRKNLNVYRIHLVTYIMPEEAIKNNIYKIVGLIVQKNNDPESVASLDLRFNNETKKFEYIYCDHKKDTVEIYKTLDRFPDKDDVLKNIFEQMFKGPIRDLILS